MEKPLDFFKDLKALFLSLLLFCTKTLHFAMFSSSNDSKEVQMYLVQGGNRFFVFPLFKNLSIIVSASFKTTSIKSF